MSKRIFVSFNYAERAFANDVRVFFQKLGGPVQATPVFVEKDVSAGGEPAIKEEIRRHVTGCRGLLVVVGDDAHNSPWMNYEVGLATSQKIPVAYVRHPRATGGPPNAQRGMPELTWDPKTIATAIASW